MASVAHRLWFDDGALCMWSNTGTQRPRDKKLLQYSAERGSPRDLAGAKHFAGPVFTFQDIRTHNVFFNF